ncbi:redox-sensitive transcriptional activator SoxR [Pseudoxanthomonas sp. CAU 1598]|uniref:Redox-sensitive transcriptional activator SoxR n=1 Tax=Pseudomarimonas arenosa TaxID=2774145 RepID=A0AAW3ZKQ8_9GAMM|nr:redox-sensitive transcriptional activator SoxR [Pseudomarimonas arenosa]
MRERALLRVGELAERAGVAVSALHYYESRGLIRAERNAGNQRRYPREMLRRVAFIRSAQQLGISLDEIAEALTELPAQRTPTKADWARLSRGWRQRIELRIEQLLQLRDQLDQCIGCGCLSLQHCRIHNANDALGRQGAGPRRWLR